MAQKTFHVKPAAVDLYWNIYGYADGAARVMADQFVKRDQEPTEGASLAAKLLMRVAWGVARDAVIDEGGTPDPSRFLAVARDTVAGEVWPDDEAAQFANVPSIAAVIELATAAQVVMQNGRYADDDELARLDRALTPFDELIVWDDHPAQGQPSSQDDPQF